MSVKTFPIALAALAVAFTAIAPSSASAWGDTGHRMIGEAAMRRLPEGLPAFLYTEASISDVGQYSREPDLWRKAGLVHDADRDPAHLIRLDDTGTSLAGMGLTDLPATRSLYEAALRAKGVDPVVVGYLPYSLADAYLQVTKDMAFLRLIALADAREKDPVKRAWLKAALRRRQDLTLRDIGILSHYIGDAAQPMHMSIHYDGWGDFPNPQGFTTAHIHWPLEGAYVRQNVTFAAVLQGMAPYAPCADEVQACVAHRLETDFKEVIPLFELEKAGGFKPGDPRGAVYLTSRLAHGASDLRDMLGEAWRDSSTMAINFAEQTYRDAEAGRIPDLYLLLTGDS
ncbi:hypothetical protein [Asticcacaulis sp. 201]|uniref:hypothetical protein n=1 Tax=Asticcacaulis sp. 201 TaxID=3028787 RepID=UPI0029170368|nr:hypothetical protein [Asticcacaulis sp. 201]MDV6330410.1 hypothetical protein [Asticcacaulis sp. 201]